MNPFDPYVDGVPEPTAGPQRGFFEGLWDSATSSFDNAYRVDSTLGIESEVQSRWEDSVRRYEKVTGSVTGIDTSSQTISDYINPVIDPEGKRGLARALGGFSLEINSPTDNPESQLAKARQISEAIKELRDPNILSLDDILQQVIEARKTYGERATEVSDSTGGVANFIGSLLGGVAGSMTFRDPVNIATLGLGGVGKSIAAKIGGEMLVGAGTEFAVQEASIQPTREVLGEERGNVLEQVAYAALGAGVLRGGFEGLGRIASRRAGFDIEPFGAIEDTQLRQMFEARPESPQARAGLSLLDDAQAFESVNPYGATETGIRHFTQDLLEVQASFEDGRWVVAPVPRVPEFNLEALDLDTTVARDAQPQVFARVVETQQTLAELDTRIAELTQTVDNVKLAAAVERIDPDSAALLRSLEDDLAQPALTREKRAAVARKIDQVVKSIGEDTVQRAINDTNIGPRKELQRLRKERQAASKQYKAARNTLDSTVARVKLEREIKEQAFGKPARTLPRLKSEVMPERHAQVTAAADALDDYSRTLVPEESNPAGVDLGDGRLLPHDFTIPDPDNPAKNITLGNLMQRIREDDQLLDAMRTCAI